MPLDSFFVRRSRRILKSAVARPRFCVNRLEDRMVPAIMGTVFQDYNANGAFDTTGTLDNASTAPTGGSIGTAVDVGFPMVTVTATPANGAVVTAQTGPDGKFMLNTAANTQYRIEFAGLPTGFVPGPHGPDNGTPVQFVNDGATNAGLGLVRESEYFGDNPLLITSQYHGGDAGLNGNWEGGTFITRAAVRAEDAGIVGFPYSSGSADQLDNAGVRTPDPQVNAPVAIRQADVGTTWGTGLDRGRQRAFASAFTKRHAGWGPGSPANPDSIVTTPNGGTAGSPGTIYTFDLPAAGGRTTTATPWFSLPVGTVLGSFTGFRSGYTSLAAYERDSDDTGWDAVGKTSFGGLDVNDAGTQVYVMNLADRRLYVINVNPNGTPGAFNSFAVPTPAGVPASDVRPFAVEFHNGLVYVGLVNSAESSQDRDQLRAYVYTFDPATNTYSAASVLSEGGQPGVSLAYTRRNDDPFGSPNMFMPWSPTVTGLFQPQGGDGFIKYPQPMLTGIAFDAAGNMTLGIRDRTGDATGRQLPSAPTDPTRLYQGFGLGDLLKTYRTGTNTWVPEANAGNPANPQMTPVPGQNQVGQGPNNQQGPGGGEFYAQDGLGQAGAVQAGVYNTNGDSDGNHRDVNLGGVTQLPGFPDVLTTVFDPQRGDVLEEPFSVEFRSAGVRWFNSSTGLLDKSFRVYAQDQGGSTFGKANGLGDLIAAPTEPPPVEIGNRLFRDTNQNGIQEAGEPVLANVQVELWSFDGLTKLSGLAATTDANGLYYFRSGPADAVNGNTAIVEELVQGQKYQVRIPNAIGPGGQQGPLAGLRLTTANVGGANSGINSVGEVGNGTSAPASAAVGVADLTATARGESLAFLDFGFVPAPQLALGDFVFVDVNNNGTFDPGSEQGLDGVPVALFTVDTNGNLSANPVQQANTVNGNYLFTNLTPGKYVVQIAPGAGYRSSSGGGLSRSGPVEPAVGNSLVNNQDHGTEVSGSLAAGFVIRANPVTLFDPDNPGAGTNPSTFQVGGMTVQGNAFQDFGVYKAFSLGNRVWLDKNNSGTIDAADGPAPGINGVTVRLYSPAALNGDGTVNTGAAPLLTTTTANGGYYRFDDLTAGQYVVVVDGASGPLAGLRSSTGAVGLTGPNEPAPGAIPAPSDPAARLDSQDTGTTVPGNLVRGPVYTLGPAANAPTNETDIGPGDPGAPNAQSDLSADFGFFQALSLGNLVFNDKGNDGVFTPGTDVGIPGVTVQLFRADAAGNPIGGAIATQPTDGTGGYLFTGLVADAYVVRVNGKTLPAGFWRSSSGSNGSLTGPVEPAVAPNDGIDNKDRGNTLQQDAGAFVVGTGRIVLTADNPTVDFGFYQPVSVGNLVFSDPNNNGLFEPGAGEAGLAGVPVRLFADSNGNGQFDPGTDAQLFTTATNGQGFYLFTDLAAGGYFVEISPPAGFIASRPVFTDLNPTGDNQNHGTAAGAVIRSGLVTVAAGGFAAGFPATPGLPDLATDGNKTYAVDFGILQTLALGDTVFEDANNNGVFDRGTERGLTGIQVDLLNPTGTNVLQTTVTGAGGTYLFTGLLPGQYQIRVTPPSGMVSSTGKNGSTTGPFEPGRTDDTNDVDHGTQAGTVVLLQQPVNLLAGGQNPDNGGFANLNQDFGLFNPLLIGDFVWEDANNNGTFDAGETPLQGVGVTLLDSAGATVATASTDANGNYLFTNLTPGTYTVSVTPPAGFVSSTGKNGSLTGPFEPGKSDNTNNVDHGSQPGLVGVATSTVTLAAPNTTNPDIDGRANLRQDFGFFRPLSVGDFVWNDVNNNGAFDTGESPLQGVAVALIDSTGATVGTASTNATGNYLFTNLTPGTYTVRVTPPAGFVSSTGANGNLVSGPFEPGKSDTSNNTDHGTTAGAFVQSTVTLAAAGSPANPDGGTANLRQDFGLFQPIRIGQIVFTDTNNNGIQDAGDAGVPNVTVQLLDSSKTVVLTTTTGTDGKYQFAGLTPGTYTVQIVPPAGQMASTPVFGPLEASNKNTGTLAGSVITSAAGTLVLGKGPAVGGNTDGNFFPTFNFGLVPVPPPVIAQVSGFTYLDVNRNGVFDQPNGDRPIPNVTVTITGNGITRTTTSDGTGFYQFTNLPPGSYTITETQPGGILYQGTDNPGSLGGTNPNENILTVTLAGGDNGLRYNFGEVLPGFLNGYVWVDRNRNCVFDPTEIVVGNVPVTISGTAFAGTSRARPLVASDLPGGSLTVLTDAGGFYSFPVLPPGSYTVSRGGLPAAAAAVFRDWCLQIGDPTGNRPSVVGNTFGGVDVDPAGRGPLNFGLISATDGDEDNRDNDPTKRNFLGSTNDPVAPPPTTIPAPGGPTRPSVPQAPTFATTTGTPATPALVVTATGAGTASQLRVFDYAAGFERFRLTPYEESFVGGVRTATGDVDGDGTPDVLTVTGPGGGPRVRAFSGRDGSQIRDFFAFESSFRGGAFVTAGDLNGDGRAEIIVGAEQGGGPRVIVFDGATGAELSSFFAFDPSQRGGVRVAAGDFDNDGRADIVTTTGVGVPTRVRTFSGRELVAGRQTTLNDFAPYESTFTGGVNLAVGDYNGDGQLDVVVGAEAGGGPRVQAIDGKTQAALASFFAFEPTATGGVRVAARDVNGDGRADLVVTPGAGGAARVRVLRAGDLQPLDDFFAFAPEFTGGAFVG